MFLDGQAFYIFKLSILEKGARESNGKGGRQPMYEVLQRVSLSRASTDQQVCSYSVLAEVSSGRWHPGDALASYPRSNQIEDQGLGASCVCTEYVCVCVCMCVFGASVVTVCIVLYSIVHHTPLVPFLLDRSASSCCATPAGGTS